MRTAPGKARREGLPRLGAVLVVIAHPDDESFGLGAVISTFVDGGTSVAALCFTRGGASTLGEVRGDLGEIRRREFAEAAAVLSVAPAELLDYPDGGLESVPLEELAAHVSQLADETGAEALLVFDENGVTGHPDHRRATAAALEAARPRGLTVLAWTIPVDVAGALNDELGTTFVGRGPDDIEIGLAVDRRRQLRAIARHASQSTHNPALWRRLDLQGDREGLTRLWGP